MDVAEKRDDSSTSPGAMEDTPLMRELTRDHARRRQLEGLDFEAPQRTRIITVANQKGGVGKTSSAVNIAAALAMGGLQVLVIDADPQGNASTALSIEHHAEVPGMYEVLVDSTPIAEIMQEVPDMPGLLCAPATINLSGAEIELVSLVARENRLKNAITELLEQCEHEGLPRLDYVIVDCPPSLGLLTVNALVAAREVLIPIQAEYYALEGLSLLLNNIELIRRHLNPDLVVSTIMLTMYDARTRLAAQVAQDVRDHFPEQTLETTIPRSVRISEAPSYGQTVLTYDPSSSGALAYRAAAHELNSRTAP
ncbi:ParA family protein [Brachybacterium sp. Marseille-Q7125]|uniref:ParA family protein n=1 Tax=Brachybacterium sp. Marseille-Q7125 TaxID=2932815 RepID=UPI001FF6FA4F|nr:ParA family protein [Brachybacterium sp. Marseille-Q7125]